MILTAARVRALAPLAVMLLVFGLRSVHFVYATRSPLTFQIGPDEDYYLRFALDVAFGSGGLTPEFGFMDPLLGYVLGAVAKLNGGSVFPIYVFQLLLDCGTAWGLMQLGRELDRPRVGLGAALLYALLGPAMAFSMMLLKATWVAFFISWWSVLALRLLHARGIGAWVAFGVYCGLGIALRSNLLMLAALGIGLLPVLRGWQMRDGVIPAIVRGSALLFGLILPLALLAVRNHEIFGRWLPVPTNGGVVLHQLYNPENPRSLSGAPSFVRYGHPSEIWRAYAAEAELRHGRTMGAAEVDDYWRAEAMTYLKAHPLQNVGNGLRKLAEFSAYPEVPNNRSYADERRFSPLLRLLPQPFGWLFAFGVPGLAWLLLRDRRALVLLAPVATGLITIAVFFAEDRFRFNIITPFVFGTAVWVGVIAVRLRARDLRGVASALLLSTLLGAWSLWRAQYISPTPMDWQRIATGYLKMGEPAKTASLLEEVERTQPRMVGLHEFRGVLALQAGNHLRARSELEAALAQRQNRHEVWHNYASALHALGEDDAALAAEVRAHGIDPLPEYLARIAELLEALGRNDEARGVYVALSNNPAAGKWRALATRRLKQLQASSPQ